MASDEGEIQQLSNLWLIDQDEKNEVGRFDCEPV